MLCRGLCLFFCVLSALLTARAAAALRVPRAEPVRREAHFTIPPFLQDVRTDGIVVVWETDVPATGVVRLDLPGRRTAFLSPPGTHHEVRLSGLRPGTRYHYVVAIRPVAQTGEGAAIGTMESRSTPAEFTTATASGPFTFLVYGDNRDRDADHAQVIRVMAPEAPDFVIQTGDMTGNAGEDYLWRRFFNTASPVMRAAAMYPALGNHELRGDPDASHFYRYFVLPGGENSKNRVIYYSFRYSNSLFVALDGNTPYDAGQTEWLERTLQAGAADKGIRHIFAFVHQPPYAVGAYCGSEREQRRFVPLFIRYKVRAVFGGHEHAYQHLERGGLRYFVSGGGGAPLYPRSQPCTAADQKALRLFRSEHHYLRVRVRGDEAVMTAIGKTGQVIEEVLLHKPVPQAPDEDEGPKVAQGPLPSPLMKAAVALPLAAVMATTAAAGTFVLLRRLRPRRRRDQLPGGEPPPKRPKA